MSIITSPELFINIKRIPDKFSKEYDAFFEEEKRKSIEGVTINGVRLSGWLYWHICQWYIDVDLPPDPITNYIPRKTKHPDLRDNEWIIGDGIDTAERDRRGLLIIGSRQFGKSEVGASYTARKAICFPNTQNVIAGLSDPDLKMLTAKIDRGFVNIHPYFRPTTPRKNWEKEVILGYKDKQDTLYTYSQILIRNLDKGDNTEILAGPTTSSLLLDEVGKGDFLESFVAVRPSLETPYGWRCSPLFFGTSGSFDKSQDLQTFYASLDSFRFDSIKMRDEDEREINFVPGFQASKIKRKKIRLSTYLNISKGSELDVTPIHIVEDVKEGANAIRDERKAMEEIGEYTLLKKETMYFPLDEEELFLTDDSDNPFADIRDLAKEHLEYLESIDPDEKYGWMTRDSATGKPKFVPAENSKKPIQNFPTGDKEDKDAPIIIFADPLPGQEFGVLHVSGSDPYNQDESFYSPSLGTLYIYRRTYDPISGKFQESIVASYSARPSNIGRWQEQCRLLLEYYGATCLPENEDASFIRYFDEKNIGYYIEDGLDLAKEINPKTKVTRKKGLAATTANIRYGNGLVKNYCLEDIVVGQTIDNEPIIKKGIVRIKDKALLREIIGYKPAIGKKKTPESNIDRVVAFRHALIIAASKDKFFPIAKVRPPVEKEEKPKKVVRSPFSTRSMGAFNVKRKGPFSSRR